MNTGDARYQARKYLSLVARGGNGARWWEKFTDEADEVAVLSAIEEIAGEGPELDRAMRDIRIAQRERADEEERS